jgi:hypothetical protein
MWTRTLRPLLGLLVLSCGRQPQPTPVASRTPTSTSAKSAAELPRGPVGPAEAALRSTLSRDFGRYNPGKDVERSWLLSDLDVIERTRRALPPPARPEALIEMLPTSIDGERVALGFGQTRLERSLPGGYLRCRFAMLVFRDAFERVEVHCNWPQSSPAAVNAAIRDALGPAFAIHEAMSYRAGRVSFGFPKRSAEARAVLDRELGELAAVAVPEELRESYELLLSPFESLDIGDNCYEGGSPPEGRVAARKLVAARRADLLRNALRGPNPEGRLYAARGLRDLEVLSTADHAAIGKLRKLELPLATCHGCMVGHEGSEPTWQSWLPQRL